MTVGSTEWGDKISASLIPDGLVQVVPGQAGATAAEAAQDEGTRGDSKG